MEFAYHSQLHHGRRAAVIERDYAGLEAFEERSALDIHLSTVVPEDDVPAS